jgi:multidrug efflux pump subunit AcrB
MAHPAKALTLGAVVIAAGLLAGVLLRRELFATGAERDVVIAIYLPADIDPVFARQKLAAAWSSIDKRSVAAMWLTRVGANEDATIDMRFRSAAAARDAVKQLRAAHLDARIRPSAFIEAVGGDASRVEIIASAATEREAADLAARVDDAMRARGFHRSETGRTADRRLAILLRWDERLLAQSGRDRRAIESDVRAALGNIDAGQSAVRSTEPSIRMLPTTPEDVALAPVHLANAVVPASAIAGLRLAAGDVAAAHDERRPAQRLTFEGGDPPAVTSAIAAIAPNGSERIRLAGHAREMRDAFAQMRLALVLAAILLYLTVAAFYESLLLPLPVIAALPFAGAGAFVALLITGQSLNLMSLLGLIFLGGVVVNHTVVLLDRAEHLRAEGVPEDDAIRRAAQDRYRPVIMTTLTAIVGMLPLAIAGGPGVELRRSIAVVVIGGLLTATAGTLVLIPLLHRALEPWRKRPVG